MSRRGISLLEVLFAIFVVAVGLLSLASLIPAGKVLLVDAGKSDRGAAAGQAALTDIKVRGLLNPGMGAPIAALPTWSDSLCIDPLYIGRNIGTVPAADLAQFPYGVNPPGLRMPRITLWPSPPLTAPSGFTLDQVRLLRADPIFTSADDLTFELAADGTARTKRVFNQGDDGAWGVSGTDDDGANGTDDLGEAGWPGSDDTAGSTGDYTWLATVAPALSERPHPPADLDGSPATAEIPFVASPGRRSFTVSVAVFYKRNFVIDPAAPVPSERIALAHFTGSGIGGGDVQLTPPGGAVVSDEYFKLKPGQWIMLAGWVAEPRLESTAVTPLVTTPEGSGRNRPVYRWYRIASLASEFNELGRDATLAGPDWIPVEPATLTGAFQERAVLVDTDGDGLGDVVNDADSDSSTGVGGSTVVAYLFDGLIGVYEKTIRID